MTLSQNFESFIDSMYCLNTSFKCPPQLAEFLEKMLILRVILKCKGNKNYLRQV